MKLNWEIYNSLLAEENDAEIDLLEFGHSLEVQGLRYNSDEVREIENLLGVAPDWCLVAQKEQVLHADLEEVRLYFKVDQPLAALYSTDSLDVDAEHILWKNTELTASMEVKGW